jgi:hypothetical protein
VSENDIIEALLLVPGMAVKETRNQLLADLSFFAKISDTGNTPWDHVRNVVRACAERQGGFRELFDVLGHLSDTNAYKALANLVPVSSVDPSTLSALAYQCDRSDQHDAMIATLLKAKKRFDRPFVFLYNGDKDQGYDPFIEVVKQETIYAGSELNPNEHRVNHWKMAIPSEYGAEKTFGKKLCQSLSEAVCGDRKKDLKEINETMVLKFPGPTIVTTYIYASNWRDDGLDRITGFLKFWEDWPAESMNYPLIVSLGVWFEISHRRRVSLAMLSPWNPVKKTRSEFAAINLAAHQKIVGERLPTFRGVELEAAQTWIGRPDVRKIRDGLDAAVRELYNTKLPRYEPDDSAWIPRIPMDRMIEELLKLLDP